MPKHIRRIQLNGTNNFRDLGGYCTNDGKSTCWGKLFRSGSLSALSADDQKVLEELNVKTVVDLRCKTEAEAFRDILPESINYYHCPVQDFEVNPDGSPLVSFESTLQQSYERMLSKTGRLFCNALNKIAQGLCVGSVVFHCSAGKDRTGTMSASILKLLNVCDEDILADYQISGTYNRNFVIRSGKDDEISPERSYLFDSNPDNLKELYTFFINNNLEEYLLSCGLKKENIITLREQMLED